MDNPARNIQQWDPFNLPHESINHRSFVNFCDVGRRKGDYFDTFSYIAPLNAHHHIAFPLCRCSSFSNLPNPDRYPIPSSRLRNSIAAYSILNPSNHGHQLCLACCSPRFRTHRCIIKAYNNGRRIYNTSAYQDRPFNRGRS